MTWFYATSVSVSNGQDYVTVNIGDDIAIAQAAGGLVIGTNPAVEIKRTYVDGSGNKRIELVKPWPYATQTSQPAFAYPTDGDFAAATAVLKDYINTFIKATQVEAEAGTEDSHFMTPLRVKQAVDFYRAFASNAEALAGSSTSKVMNPLRVMEAIQQTGLFTDAAPLLTDCNNVLLKTYFFRTSDTTANRPTTDTKIYHGLQIAYSNQVVRQIVWESNTGGEKLWTRGGNGSPLVWTTWREIWHSGNLVKQTGMADETLGRVMTVGAFGLGYTALDLPDFTASAANIGRFCRFTPAAVGKPSFISAGSVVILPYDGSPSTHYIGAGVRAADGTRGVFFGYKGSANATPTWHDTWDKTKNPAQTNLADATTLALLTAGSFGIGGTSTAPQLSLLSATLDTTTLPSGVWRILAADTGTKPNGYTDFCMFNMRYNSTDQTRIAIGTTGEMFTYASAGGVWNSTGWRRQYDSLNALGGVAHDGTKNTGGLMEYGSNANGIYYKYADGRLECILSRSNTAMTANTDDVYTWTYPAAFAVTPLHIGTFVGGASVTNTFNINKTACVSQAVGSVTMRTNVSVSQNHVLTHVAIGRWR